MSIHNIRSEIQQYLLVIFVKKKYLDEKEYFGETAKSKTNNVTPTCVKRKYNITIFQFAQIIIASLLHYVILIITLETNRCVNSSYLFRLFILEVIQFSEPFDFSRVKYAWYAVLVDNDRSYEEKIKFVNHDSKLSERYKLLYFEMAHWETRSRQLSRLNGAHARINNSLFAKRQNFRPCRNVSQGKHHNEN